MYRLYRDFWQPGVKHGYKKLEKFGQDMQRPGSAAIQLRLSGRQIMNENGAPSFRCTGAHPQDRCGVHAFGKRARAEAERQTCGPAVHDTQREGRRGRPAIVLMKEMARISHTERC